ncbi:hypothetical protein SDC9_160748 [bioreactor metagenome]|uniref:Uncharacterized protein n=1 Tax=bioreactor metagenome TaxID=1076179 RepID=A0A645FGH1_9ZZZZ
MVVGALGTMRWHEGVFNHHIVRAGGTQSQHIPVVFDAIVGLGHKESDVLQCARAVALGQQAAQEQPIAVLGAAGKSPAAAELVAALYWLRLTRGHIGGGNARCRILAPHVLLRLSREQRQLPGMNPQHTKHPSGGHAALGQFHLDAVEHTRVHLEAAPTLGLQHAKEAFARHFLNDLVTDAAFAIRLLGTLCQLGRKGLGLLDHLQRFGGEIALRREFVRHCVHLLGSPSPPFLRLGLMALRGLPPMERNALTPAAGIHRPN